MLPMTDAVDPYAREAITRLEREIGDRLRTETYKAEKDGMIARIAEVEKDNIALEAKVDKNEEREAANRRLVLTALVMPILVGLIMLYIQAQVGTGK